MPAGIARLISQSRKVAEMIPRWLSETCPKKVRATASLIPNSAKAMLGITAKTRKDIGMSMANKFNGMSTWKKYRRRINWIEKTKSLKVLQPNTIINSLVWYLLKMDK